MLILPNSVIDASQRLWDSLQTGQTPPAEGFGQLLELIPDDFAALLELAILRREAGDYAGAEDYGWRALLAHPCMAPAYIELARTLERRPESKAMANSLCEIAIGLADFDESVLDKLDLSEAGLGGQAIQDFSSLSAAAKKRLVAMGMRAQAGDEPAEVTARLRQLRLLREMWMSGDLSGEKVDEILAEGAAMIPLLIGVLRGWARDILGPDGDPAAENALGLLGEMGTPAEFPVLFELVNVTDVDVAGAATWAVGRIVARHPRESARFFKTAIPGLNLPGRVTVCEQLLRYPELDPEGALLRLLSEGIEAWPPEDRDVYALGLVTAVAVKGGGDSTRAAGEVLRRIEGLSREGRQRCESMVSMLASAPPGLGGLGPSAVTVYEICGGEAVWDAGGTDFEDDEEEVEPVEPPRRHAAPGRNDPCWCNSGKKYKKCHLESDERESRGQSAQPAAARMQGEFEGLRRRIGDFLTQVLPSQDRRRMLLAYTGESSADKLDEDDAAGLVDWLVHDYASPTLGRTVIEEFLARQGGRLSAREREMVESWSKSYHSLYEAQDVKPGTGATLKDLLTGETVFVHDVSLSKQLVRWDGVLGRVLPGERGMEMSGVGHQVPRNSIEPLRQWIEADRAQSGLPWPAYLKQNLPRIRRESAAIYDRWRQSLRLSNTDGEELVISKANYRVSDAVALLAALRKCRELEEQSESGSAEDVFEWLNEKKTVLGRVEVHNGELTLECNSRERLERGKKILAKAAGKLIAHRIDEFTGPDELKRRMASEPPPKAREEDEIPKEIRDRIVTQYLEKHYEAWPDTKLPALGGKTPRQAVKTAAGRAEVISLLKSFENGEARKRQAGEPCYDISRLRAKLGLEL